MQPVPSEEKNLEPQVNTQLLQFLNNGVDTGAPALIDLSESPPGSDFP